MSAEPVFANEAARLTQPERGLWLLQMQREPEMNTLTHALLDAIETAIETCRRERARALVFTGTGRAFCCGAHLRYFAGPEAELTEPQAARDRYLARIAALFDRLEECPFPTIAAVNGFALGGGCELAMACDYIFASENASFGQPEVALGLIPGFGGTVRLTQYVGIAAARELIITGRRIDSAEALRLGLALRVLPDVAAVRAAARESLGLAAAQSPAAVASAKQTTRAVRPLSTDDGLAFEAEAFAARFGTPDMLEGTAAFLEKRRAEFLGL